MSSSPHDILHYVNVSSWGISPEGIDSCEECCPAGSTDWECVGTCQESTLPGQGVQLWHQAPGGRYDSNISSRCYFYKLENLQDSIFILNFSRSHSWRNFEYILFCAVFVKECWETFHEKTSWRCYRVTPYMKSSRNKWHQELVPERVWQIANMSF
jgi:hypothetical protein